MIIFGVEYGMMLTVGATVEIEELIPSHSITDLSDILGGTYTSTVENAQKLLDILNRGYVDYMSVMHPGESVNRLDVNPAIFKILTPGDINNIMMEIVNVVSEGTERTVIAEAIPGKNE